MNPANLSANEVLRMCEPSTDLEKRLFDIARELQSDLDYEQQRFPPEAENEDCDECDNKIGEIEDAIELIESGKVDDGVAKLKRIS